MKNSNGSSNLGMSLTQKWLLPAFGRQKAEDQSHRAKVKSEPGDPDPD